MEERVKQSQVLTTLFKPLPGNKILDWSKLKNIADDI